MSKIRILFYSDDFKTNHWGTELVKSGCEIVPNERFRVKFLDIVLRHSKILLQNFFKRQRIHVFVFRYLNDNKYLRVSLELFIRDLLTIITCKLTNTRVIWLLHNIDKETTEYYPLISKMRRIIVKWASDRVMVTDPHLIDFALQYGIKDDKLDWMCFGIPDKELPDKRNEALRIQIGKFKNSLNKTGIKNIVTGLCVSEKAKKKAHYLYADSIVGRCENREDTCVALIMIGKFPEGVEYQKAKSRSKASPYILYIDESFSVNEPFIADQIDFFYRSLTDYSIAYSLYVACDINKPVITHDFGALPLIIDKEKIGFSLNGKEINIPDYIINSIEKWDLKGSGDFLATRNWEIGATRLLENIYKTGIRVHDIS